MSYSTVPPPPDLDSRKLARNDPATKRTIDQQKYQALTQGYSNAFLSEELPRGAKRIASEDDYFYDDSDDERDHRPSGSRRSDDRSRYDEEEDPLDAFMQDLNKEAKKDLRESEKKQVTALDEKDTGKTGRTDIDEEDMQESYFNFLEEYKARHEHDDEEEVFEYDEDGNVVRRTAIEPLPKKDHSAIHYPPFIRNLYVEHDDIKKLSAKEVFELRNMLDIRVYGHDPPKPVVSFAHFSLDEPIMNRIRHSEFEKPTPIQCQAIPAALSGRDVMGLAQTVALVIVPTRELAIQVYQQSKAYCNYYEINVVCAYGGGNKHEQKRALEAGSEFVICTPGRLIDLVKTGAVNFNRTSILIFDEVDRMFELGFEPQVKSIADQIRPDRQCLMFSATMKKKLEKLALHALDSPIKIICGDLGGFNADVFQRFYVCTNVQEKWNWIYNNIIQFSSAGKVLVFVTKKIDAEDVAKKLKQRDIDVVLLHGDMFQTERNEQITAFRTGKKQIAVCTDVASRGLDIPEIRNVVNFDVARDIDTHVHRVGRTGRAGQQGFAHTLVTDSDKDFCGELVKYLEAAEQMVPPELLNVALKSASFKKYFDEHHAGQSSSLNQHRQRLGLGFKPKEPSGLKQQGSSYFFQSSAPSVSKVIQKAKGFVESSNYSDGAPESRHEIMRSALKSAFKHTFQKASTDDWEANQPLKTDPTPAWKKELDARVANINKAVQEREQKEGKSSERTDAESELPRRKSRWQK
ncbi:DEAD/DEAH box helicase domain-containing protein [Ditylenchus destructor]|nr:DEAD/DEAH box helicase domain-containing protein [Ditylenchus destructor]